MKFRELLRAVCSEIETKKGVSDNLEVRLSPILQNLLKFKIVGVSLGVCISPVLLPLFSGRCSSLDLVETSQFSDILPVMYGARDNIKTMKSLAVRQCV